ncbi:N-acylglucosamine 2-epimerase [Bacteroides pyogenes DSM 20611 = JCM 6294]|uniref:N-acylglucosamine 2-epimerase n=1 Tax=Bacteroides pyogenes DSM 20611 = JCM 6294 TaxID=1121100 RepID=W4PE52_9BACE|nr:N-acylglucosamine 2-epimerase [Bacteroides pyogenes DSM 20611 = JCM 6294]
MDTTKSVWFQGRFGFISAYAYNHIEKNPEWLEASKSCIDFLETHCFDKDGHMFFEVTEDGARYVNAAMSFPKDLPPLPWQNTLRRRERKYMRRELWKYLSVHNTF